MKLLVLFLVLLTVAGCSSLKLRCEDTNWTEYAHEIAFKQKHLEEDGFIQQCRGVGAVNSEEIDVGFKAGRDDLCTFDEISSHGRLGQPFLFRFCDGLDPKEMHARFDEGLQDFCTADNGYLFGRSGKIYQNVCHSDSEARFLPEYSRGRKEFLENDILRLQQIIADLTTSVHQKTVREQQLNYEYAQLPSSLRCTIVQTDEERKKGSRGHEVCQFYADPQASEISSQLSTIRSAIVSFEAEIDHAKAQISDDLFKIAAIPPKIGSVTLR